VSDTDLSEGQGFPHVTDIIAIVRNMAWTPEYALQRGGLVHAATVLVDGGGDGSGLYYDGLHPVLLPYVDAYQLFLKAWKPDYIAIERTVIHHKYRYQGRLDRATEREIFDIKCGPDKHPATGLQLSAYLAPLRTVRRRFAIHLLPNGRYFVEEHKDRADWPVFLGLLQIHQWRVRHGLVAESRDTSDRGI